MRAEKQLLLDEIREKIEGAPSFIFTRYSSFTASKARQLRDLLAEAQGEFEVVRKKVLRKAAEATGNSLEGQALEGHIGVVFAGDDGVAASKALLKFQEEYEETLEILGGRFEGRLCSAQDVAAIARLPSKEEMQAQILGLFEAPLSQTLALMEALLTSVPHCLENKCAKENNNISEVEDGNS